MNLDIKNFLGDSIIYGLSGGLNKVISILLFPLLIATLSESEYGLYDYFVVTTAFAIIAITFGLDSGLARYYYNDESQEYRSGLIANVLILYLLIYSFQFIALYYFFWFQTILHTSTEISFFDFQINLFFSLIISFSLNLLRWTHRKLGFVVISMGILLVQLVVYYTLSQFFQLNLYAAIKILTVINGGFFLISLIFIRNIFSFKINFKDRKELIYYSIPLGLMGILASFSAPYERTIIANNFDEIMLTKYAVISKLGILITIAINAFHTAWGPFILSRDINSKEIRILANKLMEYYVLIGLLIIWTISLLSPYIIPIFTEIELDDYYGIVALISLTFLMRGLGWLFDTAQIVNKSSKFGLVGSIIQTVLLLLLLKILANNFGLHGIVYALFIAQFVRLVYDWKVSRQWERIFKVDLYSIAFIVCFTITIYFLILNSSKLNWFENHIKAIIVIITGMIFYKTYRGTIKST